MNDFDPELERDLQRSFGLNAIDVSSKLWKSGIAGKAVYVTGIGFLVSFIFNNFFFKKEKILLNKKKMLEYFERDLTMKEKALLISKKNDVIIVEKYLLRKNQEVINNNLRISLPKSEFLLYKSNGWASIPVYTRKKILEKMGPFYDTVAKRYSRKVDPKAIRLAIKINKIFVMNGLSKNVVHTAEGARFKHGSTEHNFEKLTLNRKARLAMNIINLGEEVYDREKGN